MKLYKVHIEYETVFLAEDEESAISNAQYSMRHEIDDDPEIIFADEILKLDDLPPGWNPQCRPWGNKDPHDRTIGQILSANTQDQT
jgi:hypothetical protein